MVKFDWHMRLPLYCPVCYQVTIIKDFQAWLDFMRFKWKGYLDMMQDSIFKRKLAGDIAIYNAPLKLKKIIEDDGYLIVFCEKCIADTSQSTYEAQGMKCVRIKNMIFEEKFFDANSEKIKKMVVGH